MSSVADQTTLSAPALESRAEILREIGRLETRIAELRESLPPAIKLFFKFRCRPERQVMVYAEDREQAVQRLHDRMNANYGNAWQVVSTVVETFEDPQVAAMNVTGNLLRALSLAEAREFARDYRLSQQGRAACPKLENVGIQTLERDVLDFERWERQRIG